MIYFKSRNYPTLNFNVERRKKHDKKIRKKLKVTHFRVKWYDHELKKIVEYDHTLYYPVTEEKVEKISTHDGGKFNIFRIVRLSGC